MTATTPRRADRRPHDRSPGLGDPALSTCVGDPRASATSSSSCRVGGTHLSRRHGHTVDQIRGGRVRPGRRVRLARRDRGPAGRRAGGGRAGGWSGRSCARTPVDALVLVGDRFETAAAALAATLDRVPIVHLHGGEQTLGAFDDALRHAITKLAHLHLVSNDEHARRVIAMGEDPATVHVVGAPGLDTAFRTDLPDRAGARGESRPGRSARPWSS